MSLPPDIRRRLKTSRLSGDLSLGRQELDACLLREPDQSRRKAMFWQGVTDLQDLRSASRYFCELEQTETIDRVHYAKFLCAIGDIPAAHRIMPYENSLGPKAAALAQKIQRTEKVLGTHNILNLSEVPAKLFCLSRQTRTVPHRKNLLLYTGQLGPGGAERQFASLAMSLSQQTNGAQKVEVAVRHTDPDRKGDFHLARLRDAGIEPYVLDDNDHSGWAPSLTAEEKQLFDTLPDALRIPVATLAKFIFEKNISDIYAWQDGGVLIAALAAAVSRARRIVTSFRGLPPNLRPKLFRPEYEPLYRAMLSDPGTQFTSNSRVTAKAYSDWLSVPASRIKVIPNAVAPPGRSPSQSSDHLWEQIKEASQHCTKTIVGVFRCDPAKQPELWFETACRVCDLYPDIRFVHVGQFNLSKQMTDRLASSPYKDRIFSIGVRQDVGFWMSKGQVLLHLAKHEGSPNVIIEAQLVGLPVLATPAGGTVEAIENGSTGALFADTNPRIEDVVDKIEQLLADETSLSEFATNAKLQATKVHDPARIIEKHLDLFSPDHEAKAA